MPIKTVDSATLERWIDNDEAVIIDVREPAEHAAKSIKNAILVPLKILSEQTLPNIKGKKLVVHCHSGKRSISACEKLLAEKPELEIYNLEGGISEWEDRGHTLKTSGKFFLPLDRQVQLTIGLCILIGSILAYYINPLFAILTGFFGAGLTFAGLSGYCGLAMLMAKMPWNQGGKAISSCSAKYSRLKND